MGERLIELTDVSKTYRMGEVSVFALQEVSLVIDRGEFVAIVGPSGSGKTTLLDILGALSRPTSGRYRLGGREVADLSEAEMAALRNQKIGFIFQTFHLLPRHSALANVELPLFYARVAKSDRAERARNSLAQVGLLDRVDHRPNQLSGGQQQRVAIARALVMRPALILADEPTGNLDSTAGKEVLDLLIGLHDSGHTIVLVTHDRELAASAERTIVLKDGRVVA